MDLQQYSLFRTLKCNDHTDLELCPMLKLNFITRIFSLQGGMEFTLLPIELESQFTDSLLSKLWKLNKVIVSLKSRSNKSKMNRCLYHLSIIPTSH